MPRTHSAHINGTVSELMAQAYFIGEGYKVSKPIDEYGSYDLIVDDGKLQRVQVKTIYYAETKKAYIMSCQTCHYRKNGQVVNSKYGKNAFDLICGVERNTGSIYIIPIKEIVGRRGITFYPERDPNPRVKHFEDYKVK